MSLVVQNCGRVIETFGQFTTGMSIPIPDILDDNPDRRKPMASGSFE
jgi:hypothetical protein